jgi:hypothetical protein
VQNQQKANSAQAIVRHCAKILLDLCRQELHIFALFPPLRGNAGGTTTLASPYFPLPLTPVHLYYISFEIWGETTNKYCLSQTCYLDLGQLSASLCLSSVGFFTGSSVFCIKALTFYGRHRMFGVISVPHASLQLVVLTAI